MLISLKGWSVTTTVCHKKINMTARDSRQSSLDAYCYTGDEQIVFPTFECSDSFGLLQLSPLAIYNTKRKETNREKFSTRK